jgi:hypothetical protein
MLSVMSMQPVRFRSSKTYAHQDFVQNLCVCAYGKFKEKKSYPSHSYRDVRCWRRHIFYSWLIDGDEIVSLAHWQRSAVSLVLISVRG